MINDEYARNQEELKAAQNFIGAQEHRRLSKEGMGDMRNINSESHLEYTNYDNPSS